MHLSQLDRVSGADLRSLMASRAHKDMPGLSTGLIVFLSIPPTIKTDDRIRVAGTG